MSFYITGQVAYWFCISRLLKLTWHDTHGKRKHYFWCCQWLSWWHFFSLPCLSRHFNTKTATFEAGGSAMNDCMKRKWQESVVWRDVLYTQCERRDVIVVFCDVQLKWTFMWMMCVSGHKESSASAALNNKSNQTKANLDNDVFSSSLLQWRSEQRSFILPKCW